jgi:alpha-2-macroglobulin
VLALRDVPGADARIDAGVARILSMQLACGGFSYWPGQTGPHAAGGVMAAHALVLARRAGREVPAAALDRALDWVAGFLREGSGTARSYALYVLALGGRGETAWLDSLPPDPFLALAALESGKGDLARDLLKKSERRASGDTGSFESETRDDFVRMLARARAGFAAEGRPHDLLARCSTTYERAWACLAMGVTAPSEGAAGRFRVFADGDLVAEGSLDRVARVSVPGRGLTITADSPFHYSWHVRGHRPSQPAEDRGFWIRRAYVRVGDDRPSTVFRAGDLVAVRLFVYSDCPREYVAMEDPLPAGLEPLDLRWRTSGHRAEDDGAFDHVEKRDDRVFASATWMRAGLHEVTWLARATTAGTFAAPAPVIEEMYDTGVRGRGETDVVEVSPR